MQRHQPLQGQRLHNTNGCRAGLNHGTNQRTRQDTQNGIFGVHDKALEPDNLTQGLHSGAHGVQPLEQQTEAQDNLANVLEPGLFGVEHHECANADAEGGDCRHVQSNQDACDGSTNVGTEDNAGGLRQIHNAGIDKAHHHHGCGR